MPKKTEITDDDIKQILNENLSLKYWEFQLGVGYVYENAPDGVSYSASYLELGELFWIRIKGSIHKFICEKNQPKEWVNELITGNIRDCIVGIVTAITSKYDVSLGIAVPIASLILKTGIINFCSSKIDSETDINIKGIVEKNEISNELKNKKENK